jgi:GNAT superfamily N-acetyltransferase
LRVTAVRKATNADLATVCESLAKAFWDDPVMLHLLPESTANRRARLAKLISMEAVGSLKHDAVWSTPDGQAHAIWKPPGTWKVGGAELLKQLPTAISTFRGRLRLVLSVLTQVENQHPVDPPHWYLAVLGCEPDGQGKGKGSACMQPVLEQCDTEGLPAYLESSKEKNIPLYERYGFKVTDELRLVKGGPPLWPMWREPRG